MIRRSVLSLIVALISVSLVACGGGTKAAPRPAKSDNVAFTSLAPEVYEPCGAAAVSDSLWVLGCSGRLVRLVDGGNVATGNQLAGGISALRALSADGAEGLWALSTTGEGRSLRGRIERLDPRSGDTTATISLGRSVASHAVVAFGTLWVAAIDGRLFAVDGQKAREIDREQPLVSVVADDDGLWTITENGTVTRRSGSGEAVRSFPDVNPHAIAAAAGLGSVWLASSERGVTRLDSSSGRVSTLDVSGTVNDIVPCGGSMWLSQPDHGLRAVDADGRVVRDVALSVGSHYLICAGARLWVLSEDGRIGSLTAGT